VPTNEQRRATAKRKLERQLERRAAKERKRRIYTIVGSSVAALIVIGAIVATVVSASMTTNQGNIGLQLDNAKSPCTVNSFASLAQQGFFNDTPCHRLTTSEGLAVLQCGDPTGQGTGGPGYQFDNEYPTNQFQPDDPALQEPVVYPRGTLAMANAGPGTNGSQFFLVYKDSHLPPNYTVFGTIDQTGLATLDKIAAAGTADGSQDGKPKDDVQVKSIQLD